MGVSASSLYTHIESRDDVLTQLANQSAKRLSFPPPNSKEWRQWLHTAAICLLDFYRENLVARSANAQMAVSPIVYEPFLETLEDAGFKSVQAIQIMNAIGGWAFVTALGEADIESRGGRESVNRKGREEIAGLEPLVAPRTIKAFHEIVKLDVKDMSSPHLDWLIRGIEDPK